MVWLAAAAMLTACSVAAVSVVPLAASQVQLAPHMQVYDPPLPPGTRTDDTTWASYLAPVSPLHAMEGLPLLVGGGVQVTAVNMSWQQAGLLRLDVVVRGARLARGEGRVVTAFNWTSPGNMTLDGDHVSVPRVSLIASWRGGVHCVAAADNMGSCGVAAYCANAASCDSFMSSAPSWLAPLGDADVLLVTHVAAPGGGGAGPAVAVGVLGGGQRTQLSAGWAHTCAVLSDGSAWCWGHGQFGRLGTGANGHVNPWPGRVNVSAWDHGSGQVAVMSIAAGQDHTCAVLSDGSAWCWGRGERGQLGTGTTGEVNPWPARVNASAWGNESDQTAVMSIAVGWKHTCAVLTDSSAWCLGHGGRGRLGTGSLPAHDVSWPARVDGSSWGSGSGVMGVTAISAGVYYTCAVVSDGSAWCWGRGDAGQLGTGSTGDVSSPARVNASAWDDGTGARAVTAISAGDVHACALVSDGSAWCWGHGQNGRLGTGSNVSVSSPVRVNGSAWGNGPGQVAVTAISAGGQHTCAVLSDGSAWCWGYGQNGQLSTGSSSSDSPWPGRVNWSTWGGGAGQVQVVSITAGWEHTCAVLSDGSTWCWGEGNDGRLGTGSPDDALVPVQTALEYAPSTNDCSPSPFDSHEVMGLVLGASAHSGGPLSCTPPAHPCWPQLGNATGCAGSTHMLNWRQLASVHAGFGDDHWLRDPPLRHALPPWAALADANPGMHVALGSVRRCSAGGGGVTWQMQDTVLAAPWGSLVSLGGSAAAASALPPAACTGWRVAAVFTNGSLESGAQVNASLAGASIVIMHGPLQLRVLGAVATGGVGTVPSGGGGVLVYVHPSPGALSSAAVRVTVYASATGVDPLGACAVTGVGDGVVACRLPGGEGVVHLGVQVRGQEGEGRAAIAYSRRRAVCVGAS